MYKRLITFALIAFALLVQPLPLASQNRFTLSLDVNSASGDQGITSLNTSADQVVSIQIFGSNIQNAMGISARFEYDASQVTYQGFDVGSLLPNPAVLPEQGTNPTYVLIGIGALGGQATTNSGLVGTIRFRTTASFTGTSIRLVSGELRRGSQTERVTLNVSVTLSIPSGPSPDFDGDGTVNIADFLAFVGVFGSSRGDGTYQALYDLDSNGVIGISDFLTFVENFGKQVPPSGDGGSAPEPQTFTLPGGASLEMVGIEPGTFDMGCVSGIGCKDQEKPVHSVHITKVWTIGFYATALV